MTLNELFDALEDDNHHGLCAMLVAVATRDYDGVIRMGEIIKTHIEVGHMPYDLMQERTKILSAGLDRLRKQGVAV